MGGGRVEDGGLRREHDGEGGKEGKGPNGIDPLETEGLQEGFSEEVSPALCPNGLYSEELTRWTRQKLALTAPCLDVLTLLPTPESLLVPPVFSLPS